MEKPSSDKPLILVSNDDGVRAAGLVALAKSLEAVGEVVIVAPELEQSAGSHSLTFHRPLRHNRIDTRVHAIDGTPADCIYVALHHRDILRRKPDIVVSGINHGPNLGTDVYYSGTVAAAREGALRGILAVAFSTCDIGQLERTALVARRIVERLLSAALPVDQPVLLNVNFPRREPLGIKPTRLGPRRYEDGLTIRHDPRGREYYWIGGPGIEQDLVEGSDTEAIGKGFVSVTPLLLFATHAEHLGIAAYVADTALSL